MIMLLGAAGSMERHRSPIHRSRHECRDGTQKSVRHHGPLFSDQVRGVLLVLGADVIKKFGV